MRKIHPLQAIQAGWIRYSNKAGMYTSFTIMTLLISLVLTAVASGIGNIFSFNTFIQGTVVAILVGVVGGVINIGYAHFAAKDESGVDVEFGDFFLGFSENVKSLVLVLIATVFVSQISALTTPQELQNLNLEEENQIQSLEELSMIFEEIVVVFLDNIGSILSFLALQLFLGIVLMFAPFAASLEKQDAIQALPVQRAAGFDVVKRGSRRRTGNKSGTRQSAQENGFFHVYLFLIIRPSGGQFGAFAPLVIPSGYST